MSTRLRNLHQSGTRRARRFRRSESVRTWVLRSPPQGWLQFRAWSACHRRMLDARRGSLSSICSSRSSPPTAASEVASSGRTPNRVTLVRPGDVIHAWVGGRPGVAVPDVRGADEQEALASLRAAGLFPTRRVVRRSNSVAPGLVIHTRPRAGTEVPVGTRVNYVIATAPRERASAKRAARRSRVQGMPDGAFLSMPDQE